MALSIYLLYIFSLLIITQKTSANGNFSAVEDLRKPVSTTQTSVILNTKGETENAAAITDDKVNSRVKRHYYDGGYYYNPYRYYPRPVPIPIIVGGGIIGLGGGYGPGFGGRGFGYGGRGFGGRGFGGGFGGRGFGGGFGGRGFGGGFGGRGFGGGGGFRGK